MIDENANIKHIQEDDIASKPQDGAEERSNTTSQKDELTSTGY